MNLCRQSNVSAFEYAIDIKEVHGRAGLCSPICVILKPVLPLTTTCHFGPGHMHWGWVWTLSYNYRARIQAPPLTSFPGDAVGKESACQCRRYKRCGFDPWVRKIPWHKKWQPTPVFLPGKFHGQKSPAGYSSQGGKQSDMTEHTYCNFKKSTTFQYKY